MENLDAVIRAVGDIVFEVDREGRFLKVWTDHPEKLFLPVDQLLGRSCREVLGSDGPAFHAAVQKAFLLDQALTLELNPARTPHEVYEVRLMRRKRSGTEDSVIVSMVDVSGRPASRGRGPRPSGTSEMLVDFLDMVPAIVIWLDHDLRYKFANKVFASALGYPPEDLIGRDFGFSQTRSGRELRDFFRTLLEGSEAANSFEGEFENGRGESQIFQIHASKCGDATRPEIVFVAVNVDEQRKTERLLEEERLRAFHSARLISLGEMAGGIAHEIKNPLSIISGNIELAKREITKGAPDREVVLAKLEKARQTVYRIARIVDSMTRLSRFSDRDAFRWENLSDIVEDALSLCAPRLTGSDLRVDLAPECRDLQIFCLREQLSQVLVNLLLNALDAVAVREEPRVHLILRRDPTRGLIVEVKDNGPGVQNVDKLFSPFYTTKPPGAGTGLGLSISLKIAQAHEAQIRYRREEAESVFSLELATGSLRS